jgi:hypothetical protein
MGARSLVSGQEGWRLCMPCARSGAAAPQGLPAPTARHGCLPRARPALLEGCPLKLPTCWHPGVGAVHCTAAQPTHPLTYSIGEGCQGQAAWKAPPTCKSARRRSARCATLLGPGGMRACMRANSLSVFVLMLLVGDRCACLCRTDFASRGYAVTWQPRAATARRGGWMGKGFGPQWGLRGGSESTGSR